MAVVDLDGDCSEDRRGAVARRVSFEVAVNHSRRVLRFERPAGDAREAGLAERTRHEIGREIQLLVDAVDDVAGRVDQEEIVVATFRNEFLGQATLPTSDASYILRKPLPSQRSDQLNHKSELAI